MTGIPYLNVCGAISGELIEKVVMQFDKLKSRVDINYDYTSVIHPGGPIEIGPELHKERKGCTN